MFETRPLEYLSFKCSSMMITMVLPIRKIIVLKKRVAKPGDYVVGEYYKGNLVQGKLFDSNNNQNETLYIGKSE